MWIDKDGKVSPYGPEFYDRPEPCWWEAAIGWQNQVEGNVPGGVPGQQFIPEGKVDMTGWEAKPKPKDAKETYVNFDFGLAAVKCKYWIHANHCDPRFSSLVKGPMMVIISNLADYSKPLEDFDGQVFCVACRDWQFGKPAGRPK